MGIIGNALKVTKGLSAALSRPATLASPDALSYATVLFDTSQGGAQ